MNWKTATLSQLHLIVSDFEECPPYLKAQAFIEIQRRKKKTYTKLKATEKRHK